MINTITRGSFVVFFLVSVVMAQGPPCDESFRRFAFTECGLNGLRTAFDYWNTTCDPNAPGSAKLGAPRDAPCTMECPSGTFYSPRFSGCERCDFGTYSSLGESTSTFIPWPDSLVTYCSPQPCESWQPSALGNFLTSGNNSVSPAGVSVSLIKVFTVQKQSGGRMTFMYRVESEQGFDGLSLYLNNTRVKFPDSIYLATGLVRTWKTYDMSLPFGTTEVRWVYEKDPPKAVLSDGIVGRDRAYLANIRFEGNVLSQETCTQCSAGSRSVPTADRCELCPAQTFSLQGSSTCTVCPSGTFAPQGSSNCTTRPRCEASDYIVRFSVCDQKTMTRNLRYALTNPNCQESDATRPPPILGISCADCSDGKYYDKGVCNSCPSGQYLLNGDCKTCDAKTAAVPTLRFPTFDVNGVTFNLLNGQGFQRSCLGCTINDGGWESLAVRRGTSDVAVVLHSGFTLGSNAQAILRLRSQLVAPGYVTFKYYFNLPSGTFLPADQIMGNFYIGATAFQLDRSFNSYDSAGTFKSDILPQGTYDFAWEFLKEFVDAQVTLVLTNLEVFGDSTGGTAGCASCVPGFTCDGSAKMVPCPAGTFSNPSFLSPGTGALFCQACQNGTIAPNAGSSTCIPCPAGSTTTDGISCSYSCRFADGPFQYDLSPIRNAKFGPLFKSTEPTENRNLLVADALLVERFFFKLCGNVREEGCGNDGNGFVCSRFGRNKTLNLGTSAVFSGNKYGGIYVNYLGGTPCTSGPRTSSIRVRCDSDQTNRVGKARFVDQNPLCTYNFELFHPAACPLCMNESYVPAYTPCNMKNGTQFYIWVKRPEAESCQGGVQPPAPQERQCNLCKPTDFDGSWSGCDFTGMQQKVWTLNASAGNCYIAPQSAPKPESRRCQELELAVGLNPATIVLILILVLICICIMVVVYMHRSKNAMLLKYESIMLQTVEKGKVTMTETVAKSKAAMNEAAAKGKAAINEAKGKVTKGAKVNDTDEQEMEN